MTETNQESQARLYRGPEGVYDEMFAADGTVRPPYAAAYDLMRDMPDAELRERSEYVRSQYLNQGVTFDVGGVESPFPLDVVPRIVPYSEWQVLESGIQQRVTALEAFLDDVYGRGELFKDGVMPRKVITSSPHFHRCAAGIEPVNGVRIQVSGTDLVRGADGTFRVLEDNVRIPSGVSYVITNRRAMAAAWPEMMGRYWLHSVKDYPTMLLRALRMAAPPGVSDPNVVVLTPGVYNSAYFEHALLARMMGVELVEGRDLFVEGGMVKAHTTKGSQPVHVIYRRVDDDFLDPVHFRSDSMLGVAGILHAARDGNVTIANAVGNGVADDKLVCTYVPDLIRYYLNEEPIIPGVDTWRLENPVDREEVMDRLAELVVKPVDGSGGKGVVIGPRATQDELNALRHKIDEDPRLWIAQPVVQLSTVPTIVDGRLGPRHVDLRPFAVNDGERVQVLPGGLTRVALKEGELIVNSSQGGGSKDTWVLFNEGPLVHGQSQTQSQPGAGAQSQTQTQSSATGTQTQSQTQSSGGDHAQPNR